MYNDINSDRVNLSSRTNVRLTLLQTSIYMYACISIQHTEDERLV